MVSVYDRVRVAYRKDTDSAEGSTEREAGIVAQSCRRHKLVCVSSASAAADAGVLHMVPYWYPYVRIRTFHTIFRTFITYSSKREAHQNSELMLMCVLVRILTYLILTYLILTYLHHLL